MNIEFRFEIGGLGAILTVIFVVLKLCNLIEFSWLMCFLPLIVSVGISVLLLIVILIFAHIKEKKYER